MFLNHLFLVICGGSFGLIAAGGVFTVFISVGLIPRFEGKTHTGADYKIYETFVCLGTYAGCLFSVFHPFLNIGEWMREQGNTIQRWWTFAAYIVLIAFGLFAGIFEGCFAVAIAEMLNTIPVFTRRIGFRHGLGIAILMIALGKIVGSLFYFSQKIFLNGGL